LPIVNHRLRRLGGITLALALASSPISAATDRGADAFDTVVIDAGHGGTDEGARGPRGVLEKDVVLDVARRLATELGKRGLRVVLTRDADRFVPLEERNAIANDARGDLFVSIHANASHDDAVRGVETYFLALRASDESARQVAARENAAFPNSDPRTAAAGDPLLAILGNMMVNEHLVESDAFARMAQGRMAQLFGDRSRGVKQAPFVVLGGVQMPASLVEIGFITNRSDEKQLGDAKGREAVAAALAGAVMEFGERHDAQRGIEHAPARSGGR
jgi:N-acetylmuramoyl-L-alanine amidase